MKVVKKQRNSISCIICGMDNPASVKAMFYEMENGELWSLFSFNEQHQSYPQRVHGGMITAMLDELIGRVIWLTEPETLAVTMSLNVKYRGQVPVNEPLRGVARILQNSQRGYIGEGKIYNSAGKVLATAEGSFRKLSNENIGDFDIHSEMNYFIADNITEIEE